MNISSICGKRFLFLCVAFLLWFPQFLYVPILSPYMEFLGGNYTLIGFILSSYRISQLLSRIPLGNVSDVFRLRKPFVILGLVSIFASCLIFFLTQNLWLFLVARFLAEVAVSCWVVFTVMYVDYHEKHEVNQTMATIFPCPRRCPNYRNGT